MPGYYHLSVDVIGRGKGRSAVACAAYRAGAKLEDVRYGTVHDYTAKRGILESGIIAPEGSPEWVHDRAQLWNQLEQFEKRKDAQLAREFELGLPHQLTQEQRAELVSEFIQQEFTPRGYVADWAIHAPNRAGDDRNYHAHIMTTLRAVNDEGFEAKKDRTLNTPEQLQKWREAWAALQNRTFERLGILGEYDRPLNVDHRSYETQGVDREPTRHIGVHATALERRGEPTERGELNRQIVQRNFVARRAEQLHRERLAEMLKPHIPQQQNAPDHTPEP